MGSHQLQQHRLLLQHLEHSREPAHPQSFGHSLCSHQSEHQTPPGRPRTGAASGVQEWQYRAAPAVQLRQCHSASIAELVHVYHVSSPCHRLQLLLISSRYRSGIPKPTWDKSSTSPASPWLIFDVHGGGFIAQTSKTHCGYLFPLAIETNVPVACVNYSLAPEMQYPTQLHQVIVAHSCCSTELPAHLLQNFKHDYFKNQFCLRFYPHIFGRVRTALRWDGPEKKCAPWETVPVCD